MKKIFRIISASFLLGLSVAAQNYSLPWFKVSGGGGVSTNGQFAVSGAIGQPDAGGTLSGGQYSLTGGFWALAALPATGAPQLSIQVTNGLVLVSWPSPSSGFSLEQTGDLARPNWMPPGQTPTNDGTIKYILINPPTGNRYFRLKAP